MERIKGIIMNILTNPIGQITIFLTVFKMYLETQKTKLEIKKIELEIKKIELETIQNRNRKNKKKRQPTKRRR